MSDLHRAAADELGIFINGEGEFRIMVPDVWSQGTGECPELAFLVVAALIRLARGSLEPKFCKELNTWAEKHLNNFRQLKNESPKPN